MHVMDRIPDIARHMSNLIVRAEQEVFLATNYWEDSVASKFLTDAIRELDRRAGLRPPGSNKIIVWILYDRGSPRQLFEPHYHVPEKEFAGKNVNIPRREEVPNLKLQVMNYHRPVLGTFHSKFMVVDRRFALIQSNNVQDNSNLEMAVQLEGGIVKGIWDFACLSWHKNMGHSGRRKENDRVMEEEEEGSGVIEPEESAGSAESDLDLGTSTGRECHTRRNEDFQKDLPNGTADHHDTEEANHNQEEQTFSGTQIQQPLAPEIETLPEHSTDDPHYDEDIAREVTRIQAQLSPKPGQTHLQAVTRLLNHTVNLGFVGNPPPTKPREEEEEEQMTPYILHPEVQDPIPMALVNRAPYGPAPDHSSVSNPQNAAWLSALKNARRSVFIQSPTLNAEPLIPAIIEACERGVDVTCWVCLGYNDAVRLIISWFP